MLGVVLLFFLPRGFGKSGRNTFHKSGGFISGGIIFGVILLFSSSEVLVNLGVTPSTRVCGESFNDGKVYSVTLSNKSSLEQ